MVGEGGGRGEGCCGHPQDNPFCTPGSVWPVLGFALWVGVEPIREEEEENEGSAGGRVEGGGFADGEEAGGNGRKETAEGGKGLSHPLQPRWDTCWWGSAVGSSPAWGRGIHCLLWGLVPLPRPSQAPAGLTMARDNLFLPIPARTHPNLPGDALPWGNPCLETGWGWVFWLLPLGPGLGTVSQGGWLRLEGRPNLVPASPS